MVPDLPPPSGLPSSTFPDAAKNYALRSELTWVHWRLAMRVENPLARQYYGL